jgi:transcriptional regulator with XRE-family HTH domain
MKPTGTTNVAKIRTRKGMTQPALAKKAGVGIRAIQKFESGERSIEKASLAVALRIADALEVHPRDLID